MNPYRATWDKSGIGKRPKQLFYGWKVGGSILGKVFYGWKRGKYFRAKNQRGPENSDI